MKTISFDYYDWDEFSEYLDSLPNKDAAKLLAVISNIELYGLQIAQRQKWIKKLEDNLYEIRSKRSSNIQRAIYFHWDGTKYIITQGFTKKSQKTPKHEIAKAKMRRANFERRNNNE